MTPESLAKIYALAFPETRPWSTEEIADLIESPGGFVVAEPQGFAIGRCIGPECELLTIAVAPRDQGKGLGRLILERFEHHVASHAGDTVFLEVSAENKPAIQLYISAGYKQTGRRNAYYAMRDGRRIDALTFAKHIKNAHI